MVADFDMEVVILHCVHSQCGEVFEKSLDDLAGADEVYCPRCGTPAAIGEETQRLAATRMAAGLSMARATR